MQRHVRYALVLPALLLGSFAPARAAAWYDPAPGPRRPVALVSADHGKWLLMANRQSGTISVIDLDRRALVSETVVGKRLADLVATPDDRQLLAVDEEANELVILARRGSALEVSRRLPVSPNPVSVQVAPDGSRCFVASLWSRQLSVIDLVPDGPPRVAQRIALPFAPRRQLLLRGAHLIVADAFGGRLAVLDVARGRVESVRALPAHNIRGLALKNDELLLTHQVLNGLAETTRDDVHWGNVLTNNVRAIPLAHLLDARADLLEGSRLLPLGDVGRGAGDPAQLAVATGGQIAVALAGVGELAIGPTSDGVWRRLTVGRGPTAITASPNGRRVYVANTFADSVSIVDVPGGKVVAEVSLGPTGKLSPAQRGEVHFHDARLSHDGWFSCQSCHSDGHTNGRLNDNLGDGSFGAPKRVLSLRGVGDTGPWAWNGSMTDLGEQIDKSIRTTMHGRAPSAEQVRDLTAFLRTLPPAPPLGGFAEKADDAAVRRGRTVFERHGCAICHTPPTYTSSRTYDVGLVDEVGNARFNPPSLRGVSQGGPYFHDNRAATLDEVFIRHRHQLKGALTKPEVADLLAFLGSL